MSRKFMDAKKALEKKTKAPSIFKSSSDPCKISRIRSDVFVFDLLTNGGIPKGRITMFEGPESSGKSSFAQRMTGQYLKTHPNEMALYMDHEGTHDPDWAKHFGMSGPRCQVGRPHYAEEGLDASLEVLKNSDDIGFLALDSVAALVPATEANAEMSDQFVGLQARVFSSWLRKILVIQSQRASMGNPLTILLVNQTRTKIGARTFAPQTITPGGVLKNFLSSLTVRFYTKNYSKIRGIPAVVNHSITISKNKVGLPKRTGEFSLYLADVNGMKTGQPDDYSVVFEYAKRIGLIIKDGNTWKMGKQSFPNQVSLRDELKATSKLFDDLKAKTLEVCLADPFSTGEDGGDAEGEVDV